MTTLHYQTADYVLCKSSDPGAIPFLQGGLQPDGSYLYKFDLDSHNENQDAAALLDYGLKRIPPELAARLVIVPTPRGGYHIPFYYHKPLIPGKVYDPRTQVHAGEFLDQRIDAVENIPTLSTLELLDLIRVFPVPGVFGIDELTGESTPTTPRKEYLAIGRSLVTGWERIASATALRTLDQLCAKKPMLAAYRAVLRTSPDRSSAYSNLVQSLMLHARDLGRDTGERCAMVMAMAIATGAAGKEAEKTYKIEKDTAVLIAKILDGAPMQQRPDGTIPYFAIPRWYSGEQLPKPPPSPAPAARPPHRPAGDKQKAIARLEKLIRRQLDDSPSGRIYYCVADLADDLGCSPRSVSTYLAALETAGKIARGQVKGRGGRAYFDVLPALWHANKSPEAPKTEAPAPDRCHASAHPFCSTPMPESDTQATQCIEVLGAPKACVPNPPAPPPSVDEWAAADAWQASPDGQRLAAKAHRAAVDPDVYARIDPIASGRSLPAPARPSCGYTPGECDRWLAAHAVGMQPFGAPNPTLGAPLAPTAPRVVPSYGRWKAFDGQRWAWGSTEEAARAALRSNSC